MDRDKWHATIGAAFAVGLLFLAVGLAIQKTFNQPSTAGPLPNSEGGLPPAPRLDLSIPDLKPGWSGFHKPDPSWNPGEVLLRPTAQDQNNRQEKETLKPAVGPSDRSGEVTLDLPPNK